MATSDYPTAAIDTLLREHAHAITGESGEAEAETQFQSPERKWDALESQLMVLKEAKNSARSGNFASQAQSFEPCDWDQDAMRGIGMYGNTIGAGYQTPGLVDPNFSQSGGFGGIDAAYELDFAVAFQTPDLLHWNENRGGTITAEGDSRGVVPLPQALKIHEWCQDTIERIATTLTPDQIDKMFRPADPDFAPPWSPFTIGRIILRDRLQERILSLEKQSAALKQQWNEQLPIARLPLEILIQVFDFVLGAGPPQRRDETFILCTVLMRICRDWTGIVQNTPSLWNRISPYSSSSRQVMVALNKSKPVPLSVWFNNADSEMHRITFRRFLPLITQHVDRLTVLELHLARGSLGIVNGWLATVFPPSLRRLRISLEPKGFPVLSYSRIRPFGGHWPSSLKHFGIVGCGMDSSRYAELKGLTTLEISQLPSGLEVGVAEILHILSNCPEIENLTLGGRIVVDKQPTLLNPGSPVRLDRLREISLSLEPASMNSLIRSMQIGSCAKICIETRQPPTDEPAWTEWLLNDGIRPFVRVLNSTLSSASAVSIKVENELIKLSTDPPESDSVVRLTFRGKGLDEVGRWMAESLTLGPAPVTLYFAAYGETWMETLPLILSNFNHIVQLTFVGFDDAYQQAIDFLGTPIHTEATGHQHFPAPRLASVDVMGDYIPNIIQMVERRQSAEVGGAGRPVKLSRLILRRNLYGEFVKYVTMGQRFSDLAGGEMEFSIV